jgi:hypothetical protein
MPGGMCPENLAQTGILTLDTPARGKSTYRLSYPAALLHARTHSSTIWRVTLASQRQAYECDWRSTSSDLRQPLNRRRPPIGKSVCYCRTQNTPHRWSETHHYNTLNYAIKQHLMKAQQAKSQQRLCTAFGVPDHWLLLLSRDRHSNCQLKLHIYQTGLQRRLTTHSFRTE